MSMCILHIYCPEQVPIYRTRRYLSLSLCLCLSVSLSLSLCEHLYRFTAPAGHATSLYVMALQPSKRGAWCRSDRKKSYRPGDLSVVVARVAALYNVNAAYTRIFTYTVYLQM